jgi:hypothetical protein
MESRTKPSDRKAPPISYLPGKRVDSSSILARTALDKSMAFAPGDWKIPIPTVFIVQLGTQRIAAGAHFDTRHVAQADQRPSCAVFRMILPNSSSVCRRPGR